MLKEVPNTTELEQCGGIQASMADQLVLQGSGMQ